MMKTTRASRAAGGARSAGYFMVAALLTAGASLFAQQAGTPEELAMRQLTAGRSFIQRGNFEEAVRDFRAVAERYPTTSSADDALLELARYYLDTAKDIASARTAVDAILTKYQTSDSAAEALLLAGRLDLGRSKRPEDLAKALANFERVGQIWPMSESVPRSWQLAGETLWYSGRYADAMAYLSKVEVDYPTHIATASAYLTASRVLVSLGDPVGAMEDLQQVRNRWPNSPEAALALARLTLLHRLYVRAPNGSAFALATDTPGPAKLDNVVALAAVGGTAIYYAAENVGLATPADAPAPPSVLKPRGLALDNQDRLAVLDGGMLRLATGALGPLALPKPNGVPEPLASIESAAQLSWGDWLIVDADKKGVLWFNSGGGVVSLLGSTRVSKVALNAVDEIAGIDRDQKAIALWDPAGKPIGKIPFKGSGYDLQNPEDLAFDAFGHLYVLDRTAIAIFGPHPAGGAAPATDRGAAYKLLTIHAAAERATTGLRRGTAFAVDRAGTVFVHDDRAQRILVYR